MFESPDDLLDYYEQVSTVNPGVHWRNGIEMSRKWLNLIAGTPPQSDIDAYVERLEDEGMTAGAGWCSLAGMFVEWARSQGFHVESGRGSPFRKWHLEMHAEIARRAEQPGLKGNSPESI